MRIVNIHEAKTHFSKLIDEVLHGQEIIIAMSGKAVAKLEAINSLERRAGFLKGKIKIAKNFDEPLEEEIIADFEK